MAAAAAAAALSSLARLVLLLVLVIAAAAAGAPSSAAAGQSAASPLGWPPDGAAIADADDATTTTTTLGIANAAPPSPPVWPERFQAQLFQNRSSRLALTTLYYDWRRGVNVNKISSQLGARGVVYDVEWNNGTSFIFSRDEPLCKTLHFDVGILRPDWLSNATFVGTTSADGFVVDVFTKAAFIYLFQSRELNKPVRWTFISSGAQLDVMSFEPRAPAMPPKEYAAPSYCFGPGAANASGGGGGGSAGWIDELGALSSGALFRELAAKPLPSSVFERGARSDEGGSSRSGSSSRSSSARPGEKRQERVQAS